MWDLTSVLKLINKKKPAYMQTMRLQIVNLYEIWVSTIVKLVNHVKQFFFFFFFTINHWQVAA